MLDANIYRNDNGSIVIEADGQEIEVSEQAARFLAMRLCNLFDYRIKYEAVQINFDLNSKANSNSTKENPLGQ